VIRRMFWRLYRKKYPICAHCGVSPAYIGADYRLCVFCMFVEKLEAKSPEQVRKIQDAMHDYELTH